jgi:hypothetical protein
MIQINVWENQRCSQEWTQGTLAPRHRTQTKQRTQHKKLDVFARIQCDDFQSQQH